MTTTKDESLSEAEIQEAVRGLLRRDPVRAEREAREAPIQPTDIRARDLAHGFGVPFDGATAKQLRDAVRIALECEHAGAASHDDETGWCGACGCIMTRTGPDGGEEWLPPVILDRLRAALR